MARLKAGHCTGLLQIPLIKFALPRGRVSMLLGPLSLSSQKRLHGLLRRMTDSILPMTMISSICRFNLTSDTLY